MATSSPRVNATLLQQQAARFANQPVRVVGTVQAYDEAKTQMQICASDGGMVTVILALQNQGLTWDAGQVVEVIGAAQAGAPGQPPTLQEYTSIPFDKAFDLANYDRLVQLMHNPKYSPLFY